MIDDWDAHSDAKIIIGMSGTILPYDVKCVPLCGFIKLLVKKSKTGRRNFIVGLVIK